MVDLFTTLVFNLGVVLVRSILANLESFCDLCGRCDSGLNALDGAALGMGLFGVEIIAFVLAFSATSNITLHKYGFGQWKGKNTRSWREVRLSMSQVFWIALAIVLLIAAAYRATIHFNR